MANSPFGFSRYKCACKECSIYCSFMPGFLIPTDLPNLLPGIGQMHPSEVLAWARIHLRASPGAKVMVKEENGVRVFDIPTLVPARQSDNLKCHWLADDGKCTVHEDAPYGCAYTDSHMSEQAGESRCRRGLEQVYYAHQKKTLYNYIWQILNKEGLNAPGPTESRRLMKFALQTVAPPEGK